MLVRECKYGERGEDLTLESKLSTSQREVVVEGKVLLESLTSANRSRSALEKLWMCFIHRTTLGSE